MALKSGHGHIAHAIILRIRVMRATPGKLMLARRSTTELHEWPPPTQASKTGIQTFDVTDPVLIACLMSVMFG